MRGSPQTRDYSLHNLRSKYCALVDAKVTRTIPIWFSLLAFIFVYSESGDDYVYLGCAFFFNHFVSTMFVLLKGGIYHIMDSYFVRYCCRPSDFTDQMDNRGYWNGQQMQSIFDPVFCILLISFVQYILSPFSKAYLNYDITPMRKMYLANIAGGISVGLAVLFEYMRKQSPLLVENGQVVMNDNGLPMHTMSIWYTLILYFFGSFGQAFAWVGGIEFYYREMYVMLCISYTMYVSHKKYQTHL